MCLKFGCRKIPIGTCSPVPLSSLGVRKWAHSIAHTKSKVDFTWMEILWEHLPRSFVFLIGCCLCRGLVIFCVSSANVLLSSYSGPTLENYFSVLCCAEGTISSASSCFLTYFASPGLFMYPSCSRFCWFVSLYWQLCSQCTLLLNCMMFQYCYATAILE